MDAEKLAAGLFEATKRYVDHRLEGAGLPQYCGEYESGREYPKGSIVSHRSGVWIAAINTQTEPGADPGSPLWSRML
jgi:hypothetical protein